MKWALYARLSTAAMVVPRLKDVINSVFVSDAVSLIKFPDTGAKQHDNADEFYNSAMNCVEKASQMDCLHYLACDVEHFLSDAQLADPTPPRNDKQEAAPFQDTVQRYVSFHSAMLKVVESWCHSGSSIRYKTSKQMVDRVIEETPDDEFAPLFLLWACNMIKKIQKHSMLGADFQLTTMKTDLEDGLLWATTADPSSRETTLRELVALS
jgi:hypothetical protein